MARLFDRLIPEYLGVNQAVTIGYPITMACWFYSVNADDTQYLMSICDSSQDDNYWGMYLNGSGADQVVAKLRTTGSNEASTTTGYSINTWHHACAVFTNSTLRAAFIDGGSKGTHVLNRTPDATQDRTGIGVEYKNATGQGFDGRIAEAAIWNAALTDAEVAILARGYSPLFVRPQSLVAYWPLIRDEDQDRVGGYDMTPFNTPSVAAHAPVIYPGVWVAEVPAAAPACPGNRRNPGDFETWL